MRDLASLSIRPARVRRGLKGWIADLSAMLGFGPFASMSDAKLADHHWAAESALLRAVRCGQTQSVVELTRLVRAMVREMRRRGMV